MNTLAATTPDEDIPRARVALLLKHFSVIKDDREPWRVVYPLREVLLLVVCGTIASCDDFDDIVAWGDDHIDFLRRFCEFHHAPVSAGCVLSSTGSTPSCLAAASKAGSQRSGRTATSSLPSMARPRAEPTTSAKGSKPCIRSVPMPPMQD